MKITYIELNGYKRFRLNEFTNFAMEVNSQILLILGTNGAGKSSLLWELSPLPASKEDFTKTGSKVIKCENNGSHYVLTNDFKLKQTHSFICDGTELNPGGTISIQKELVFSHFGITNEMHEILTERERFTEMSASRRKEVFLKLSDTNYDYAIRFYNQLKIRHRDVTGALKMAKKNLVVESEKLLQEAELAKLEVESHELHTCLTHLLEYRKPVEQDLDVLSINQQQLDAQLLSLGRAMQSLNAQIFHPLRTTEECHRLITEAKESSINAQTLLVRLNKDHTKNLEKIEVLEKAKGETIEQFNEETKDLNAKIASLTSKLFLSTIIPNASPALFAQFESVRGSLQDIFVSIPANADGKYSQLGLIKKREELDNLKQLKKQIYDKITGLQASAKHMEEHRDHPNTLCPNCKHSFSINYSEQRYLQVKKKIELLEDEIQNTYNPSIAAREEYIEECASYGRYFRQYSLLVSNSPQLNLYWDYIKDSSLLTSEASRGVYVLNEIAQDILTQIEISKCAARLEEIQTILASLKEVGNDNLQSLLSSNEELEKEINHYTNILQANQASIKSLQLELSRVTERLSLKAQLQSIIREKKSVYREEIETTRRMIFNQLVKDLQSALASREHTLGAAANQKKIVEAISKQIEEYTKQELALSALVRELSPTEGLIAEGLLGFIKNFVSQMNDIIAKIWTYRLEIKSCDVLPGDSIDLDYKFPMIIKDEENDIKDVNLGSTAMKAIVNLAFRLIAMKCLNLGNSPITLDEVGSSFDIEHRNDLTSLIKSLVEQQSFSQLFIVSHYIEQYGGISNAETCVLNSSNIVLPENYNRYVTLS